MKENLSIKVLVADDHNLFRAGIIKLLKGYPNISILGEAENGDEMIQKYFELLPDLALVDIAMPGITGLEAVARIKEKDPLVKALFLSMYEGEEFIYKVLKSGGRGLINKSILETELIYAIERVYNGEKYFRGKWDDASLDKLILEFESSKSLTILNKEENINYREEQILKFLRLGLGSQEMADKLSLSKKTIDFYRSCLMRKFNLKSAADLVRFAIQYYQSEQNL
jgi:two-component system, NarL family, response regulator NreC